MEYLLAVSIIIIMLLILIIIDLNKQLKELSNIKLFNNENNINEDEDEYDDEDWECNSWDLNYLIYKIKHSSFSQNAIADKLGISKALLSNIVNKKRKLTQLEYRKYINKIK